MPKKIDERIRQVIWRHALKDQLIGAAAMHRRVRENLEAGRLTGDLPSVRTVGSLIEEARRQPASERSKTVPVTWPDDFGEMAALPWEASTAYFELLEWLGGPRPLQPLALWFWRMCKAVPGVSARSRRWMAADLAVWDQFPTYADEEDRRALEAYAHAASSAARQLTGDYEPAVMRLDRSQMTEREIETIRGIAFGVFDLGDEWGVDDWLHETMEQWERESNG